MYDSLMEQEVAFYDEMPSGILIGRLAEDVTLVRTVYVEKLLMVVQHLTQAVVGIILAFCYVWRVTLAVCIGIPMSAVVYIIGNIILEKLLYKYNQCVTDCIDKAEEAITQIRTVKAFNCELKEAALYSKSIAGIEECASKWALLSGVKDGLISVFTWGMINVLYILAHCSKTIFRC